MGVLSRSRPHCRERHQVGEVERMDERLAAIGIDMARERRQPSFDGVDRFANEGEAEPADDAPECPKLFAVASRLFLVTGDAGREQADPDIVAPARLAGLL